MEAKRTGARWTYSEFAGLPSDGGTRREIIDGELPVTPAPAARSFPQCQGLRTQNRSCDPPPPKRVFMRLS